MTQKEKITADLKAAMKAGETVKRDTLRMIDSAIKNVEIEKRSASRRSETGLSDEEVLEVISRGVKQRMDSIRQYEAGGRAELAEKERMELEILKAYLPEQLSDEELRKIVLAVISEIGAVSPSDMGKIMGEVMKRVKGKADGNAVRAIVQELLAK